MGAWNENRAVCRSVEVGSARPAASAGRTVFTETRAKKKRKLPEGVILRAVFLWQWLWQWLARRQKPSRWLSSGFQPHGVFALFAAAYQPEDQQRAQQFADAHGYDGPGRGKADDEQKDNAVQGRAHKA